MGRTALSLSLSDERISSVFFATNNVSRCGTTQEIEKKREIPVMNSSRARSGNRKNFSLANLISQ